MGSKILPIRSSAGFARARVRVFVDWKDLLEDGCEVYIKVDRDKISNWKFLDPGQWACPSVNPGFGALEGKSLLIIISLLFSSIIFSSLPSHIL